MKNEMIKFVVENFEVIKSNYIKQEEELLKEDYLDDEFEMLILLSILKNNLDVNSPVELIEAIRTREGMFNSDEYSFDDELFDFIVTLTEE